MKACTRPLRVQGAQRVVRRKHDAVSRTVLEAEADFVEEVLDPELFLNSLGTTWCAWKFGGWGPGMPFLSWAVVSLLIRNRLMSSSDRFANSL